MSRWKQTLAASLREATEHAADCVSLLSRLGRTENLLDYRCLNDEHGHDQGDRGRIKSTSRRRSRSRPEGRPTSPAPAAACPCLNDVLPVWCKTDPLARVHPNQVCHGPRNCPLVRRLSTTPGPEDGSRGPTHRGVAHDFNNLLTIIRSSTSLLSRSDLPERRRRVYMDAIVDTVDRDLTTVLIRWRSIRLCFAPIRRAGYVRDPVREGQSARCGAVFAPSSETRRTVAVSRAVTSAIFSAPSIVRCS
jgi:hypothetical protein